MPAYKGLGLPDLTEFRAAGGVQTPAVQYGMPPDALIDCTIADSRRLATEEPALYLAYLLCYELALRSGEAVHARWAWIRTLPDKQQALEVRPEGGWRPKSGLARTIAMGAGLGKALSVAALRAAKGQPIDPEGYILPGSTETGRKNLIKYGVSGWMRGRGWDPKTYPKAAHELRKLQGSRWFQLLGAEVAREWLGHKDIATTCRYYARLRKQPMALPLDS